MNQHAYTVDFFESVVNEIKENHELILSIVKLREESLIDEAEVDRSSMEFLRMT